MKTIVGVRFRKPGKVYFFNPGYIQLKLHDKVIVETSMGEDIGEVVINKREIPDDKFSTSLKKVIRLANNKDLKRFSDFLTSVKTPSPKTLSEALLNICSSYTPEVALVKTGNEYLDTTDTFNIVKDIAEVL